MIYKRKNIATYKPSVDYNFKIVFEDDALNTLDSGSGRVFPAVSVTFTDTELEIAERDVGGLFTVRYPVNSKGVSTIEVGFVDDEQFTVQRYVSKWMALGELKNGVSPDLLAYSKYMTISKHNKKGEKMYEKTYRVIPSGPISVTANNAQFSVEHRTYSFVVVGE